MLRAADCAGSDAEQIVPARVLEPTPGGDESDACWTKERPPTASLYAVKDSDDRKSARPVRRSGSDGSDGVEENARCNLAAATRARFVLV